MKIVATALVAAGLIVGTAPASFGADLAVGVRTAHRTHCHWVYYRVDRVHTVRYTHYRHYRRYAALGSIGTPLGWDGSR